MVGKLKILSVYTALKIQTEKRNKKKSIVYVVFIAVLAFCYFWSNNKKNETKIHILFIYVLIVYLNANINLFLSYSITFSFAFTEFIIHSTLFVILTKHYPRIFLLAFICFHFLFFIFIYFFSSCFLCIRFHEPEISMCIPCAITVIFEILFVLEFFFYLFKAYFLLYFHSL